MAGRMGVGLYILHNVIYAAVSYPIGVLGDRSSKKQILAYGYALFGLMCVLFDVRHHQPCGSCYRVSSRRCLYRNRRLHGTGARRRPSADEPTRNRVRSACYSQLVWRSSFQHCGWPALESGVLCSGPWLRGHAYADRFRPPLSVEARKQWRRKFYDPNGKPGVIVLGNRCASDTLGCAHLSSLTEGFFLVPYVRGSSKAEKARQIARTGSVSGKSVQPRPW